MVLIHLKGRVTESGQLDVQLPPGIPAGEVDVTLEVANTDDLPWELRPWTDEELAELLKTEPKTGAEIVARIQKEGGWEHLGITSGAEWVEAQRRKEQERRNLPKW